MAEFSNIDERVNTECAKQLPTAQPTTEVELPKPDPQIEQSLRDEIAALKREASRQQAAAEASLTEAHLKVASEQAHSRPTEKVSNGQADAELNRAISACRGLAFWTILTEAQKTAALGIQGVEQTKSADLKKIFGNSSDGMAANRLAKSSPEEYRRLRMLAKIRNIL